VFSSNTVFQIKLSVVDVQPEIWRRLLIRSDVRLTRLHLIMQVLMGWKDYHLHQFEIGEKIYAPRVGDYDRANPPKSVETGIGKLYQKGIDEFKYEYDFGDEWEVAIQFEKEIRNPSSKRMAFCVEGKRAGPLEDSGGPHGYMEKLRIIKNKKDPRYKDVADWLPKDYDPEAFDIESTNRILSGLRQYRLGRI
jgi:Plasmid pRiA4b ORF-3-like protein